MLQLGVFSVLYSLLSRHRVVLLKEENGERYLPIWVGMYESEAIAMRLQGAAVPRPLTHDLLNSVITELGGTVQHIVINDLSDSTFYARIAVDHDGQSEMIDARPSDAIALALRASVPIFVEEDVMNKAGVTSSPEIRSISTEEEGKLDAFRDFVDSLDLDDLGD